MVNASSVVVDGVRVVPQSGVYSTMYSSARPSAGFQERSRVVYVATPTIPSTGLGSTMRETNTVTRLTPKYSFDEEHK